MKNLVLCEQTVRVDDDGFVSLTDMWKASGEAIGQGLNTFFKMSKQSPSYWPCIAKAEFRL